MKLSMFLNEKKREKLTLLAAEILKKSEGKIPLDYIKQAVRSIDIFKDYEIKVFETAKEFNQECKLNNIDHEHSWAGEDGQKDEGKVLYGPNIIFGEYVDKWYSQNGNITWRKEYSKNANFDINSISMILVKSHNWSAWDGKEDYDYTDYKIIIYLPNNAPYEIDDKAKKFIEIFGEIK